MIIRSPSPSPSSPPLSSHPPPPSSHPPFTYIQITAVLAVYLGAKRSSATAKAGEIFQKFDTKNAVAAPIAASVSLFGTYYLLKNFQLDIATIYQLMTTSFGWFCARTYVG